MDILGGLTALKQTIDITKDLRNIDSKISDAEFKLKIADIVDKLLDAKQALIDAQERELSLTREIADRREKASIRGRMKDQNGLLYEIGENDEKLGEPFCNLCFVKEERLFRMRHHPAQVMANSGYKCDNCQTRVMTGPALPFPVVMLQNSGWR